MRDKTELLFAKRDLCAAFREHERKMVAAIDAIPSSRLLNTGVDDLCDYFLHEYKIEPIELIENDITVAQDETSVDISQDRSRAVFDRSQPFYITGTEVTFYIPFTGDSELFKYQASTFSMNPPRGIISKTEVQMLFVRLDHNAEAIQGEFSRCLAELRRNLEWTNQDVTKFNATLPDKIRKHVEMRREKLLKDQGLVASLGFPLRKRDNAPQTYVVPSVRRKIPAMPQSSGDQPFRPEPTLDMQEYEHILSVISNMVLVMERSPDAFRHMNEEDLRWHFLVQLNGQYEGQATGETFNHDGKTDILIRVENKNIFIAECKFWRGPKSFTEAIDQLLGYASWRDTKTALLVFNRNGNLSAALKQIPDLVKAHPQFKRQSHFVQETGSRYVLHHAGDQSRELIMTVLCFDIPA